MLAGGGDIVDYTQLETPYVLIATPPFNSLQNL